MWLSRPDIQGGLDRLGDAYSQQVGAVYTTALNVSVVLQRPWQLVLVAVGGWGDRT